MSSLAVLGSAVLGLIQKGAEAEQRQVDIAQYEPVRFVLVNQAETAPLTQALLWQGLVRLSTHEGIETDTGVSEQGEAWKVAGPVWVVEPDMVHGQVPPIVLQVSDNIGPVQIARMLRQLASEIEKEMGVVSGADDE